MRTRIPLRSFEKVKKTCFTTDVFVPYRNPEGDAPNEDSKGRITWCNPGVFGPPTVDRVFWSDDEKPPSLLEQAQAAKADCFHEYRRSSYRGTEQVDGHSAYGVKVTAIYGLRFEVAGKEVQIAGAPKTLDAPTATTAMRVNEVQSVVTGIN